MDEIHIKGLDHFNQEIEKHKLVLVDFWAGWCGPCRALGKVIEEKIYPKLPINVTILKVDCDQNRDLVEKYGVRGIPCLIFFKEGKIAKFKQLNKNNLPEEMDRLVGNHPQAAERILAAIQDISLG